MSMSGERLTLSSTSYRGAKGFTLVEIMVTLVLAGVTIAGIYTYLGRQRKVASTQRLRADMESLDTISFFIIGRDIRRAGSNPRGALGYSSGVDIPLSNPTFDSLELKADLDGNGTVSTGTDEDIIYQYIDNPASPDGVKDQIRRQSGNQLVIENVRGFDIDYQVASGAWYCSAGRCNSPYDVSPYTSPPPNAALIRKVRIHLKTGTGHVNQQTGVEDTKEIQENILLRNFR